MNIQKIIRQPIFFERNRVYRIYTGGEAFPTFFNTNEEGDNSFPEEWVASSVDAKNQITYSTKDGISIIKNTTLYFDDLLNKYKDNLLGNRKYDILVKILDSAIRLPVQVHPTKEFSKQYLNSEYGKTEAWYVIKTRPNAKMYLGFKKKITQKQLHELVEQSFNNKDIMLDICMSFDVREGDIFLINAGLVHAIGAGCTLIEIQEPTDFTIQPEHWSGDQLLSPEERLIGLDENLALSCFNYNLYGDEALKNTYITPKILVNTSSFKKESLINYSNTPSFALNKYLLNNSQVTMPFGPSVWIVLEGEGIIQGENYIQEIKQGDYYFLPFSAQNNFKVITKKKITLIECLPSQQ